MAPSFHQLHIFYTVATKGSFSAAAQALHLSQPAVTMQIRALEEAFGTRLFHRSTKKVELSDAGRALLPHAEKSILLMRETSRVMSRFTHSLSGKLELGASLTFGEFVLPRILGEFGKEYPHIAISMTVMNTRQILDDVLGHKLTIGLVEAELDHPDLHIEPVLSDELKLILPAGHPLLDKPVIRFEDVTAYPFILREPGSGTRDVMEKELARCGHDPSRLRTAMEIANTGAIKSAVEAGYGLAIMSPASVRNEVALGLLAVRDIDGLAFKRHFYVIYLNSTLLPLPAVTFLTFLKERNPETWLT